MMNEVTITMAAPRRARVDLYGDIGPSWAGMIDAQHVASKLGQAGELDTIELHINSRGGSAYDGLAIASILRDHPAKIEAVVDGVAASAASLIAVAADTLRIPTNAIFMIHDPQAVVAGGEAKLSATIEQLRVIKKASIALYAAKSGKSEKDIAALMTAETWYTGDEAVAAGFADQTEAELPADKVPAKEKMSFDTGTLQGLAALSVVSLQAGEPSMATNQTPAQPATGTAPAAVELTPVAGLAAVPQISQADVAKAANDAAVVAVGNERKRVADVLSLCTQAKKPELARQHIDAGTPVAEVQAVLFKALCEERKPTDEGQSRQELPAVADPNLKYQAEYKANPHYAKLGLSAEDYIASRRVDEGLDKLAAKAK